MECGVEQQWRNSNNFKAGAAGRRGHRPSPPVTDRHAAGAGRGEVGARWHRRWSGLGQLSAMGRS